MFTSQIISLREIFAELAFYKILYHANYTPRDNEDAKFAI